MAIKTASLLVSLISIGLLSGCTTPGRNMLPHGDMTMAQIYRVQAQQGSYGGGQYKENANYMNQYSEAANYQVKVRPNEHKLRSVRASNTSVNSEFKVLPNPNIPVYVFPHMAHYNGSTAPVPGYGTSFFMYEKNHYAMPGEDY